jgi:hypothetical protein
VTDYRDVHEGIVADRVYRKIRLLDPNNLNGSKKPFFNPDIVQALDDLYTRKLDLESENYQAGMQSLQQWKLMYHVASIRIQPYSGGVDTLRRAATLGNQP